MTKVTRHIRLIGKNTTALVSRTTNFCKIRDFAFEMANYQSTANSIEFAPTAAEWKQWKKAYPQQMDAELFETIAQRFVECLKDCNSDIKVELVMKF
jgi:hypothetical protein